MLAASGISDGRITPAGLRWLMEQCLEAGNADASLPGLKNDRRAVIGGGLPILYTLATHFGIAELKPARGALRQGVIFDLPRARRPSVVPAARTCATPRCASCSGASRSTSRRRDGSRARARPARQRSRRRKPRGARELAWAAALHEAGMMISHHDHHRHSAYLLAHVDAAGFSQSQLRRIGDLVLGQRGGLRKMEATLQDSTSRCTCSACAWRSSSATPATTPPPRRSACAPTPARRGRLRRGLGRVNPRAVHLLRDETDAWAKTGLALAPRLDVG